MYIRGCQIDNTGLESFPKGPQVCKFDVPIGSKVHSKGKKMN